MKEIVKYHNDFNKIKLPNFTELHQNLLFGIIQKIRGSQDNIVNFLTSELQEFAGDKNYTHHDLFNEVCTLKNNLFKADFTIIQQREQNRKTIRTINLFQEFAVHIKEPKETALKALEGITIKVNPDFTYLVDELTANFTRFELAEFIALNGKYTKTLYRLLKQYRQTGWVQWDFKEFKHILDIPECYRQIDIDQQILKPALRELTVERNLFDTKRIPFKDLSYTKIKGKGRGRGGNVIAIRFDFKPEKVQDELEAQEEARIAENIKNHIPTSADYEARKEFENYIGITLSFYDSNHRIITGTIKNFDSNANKLLFDNFSIAFENLQKANEWIAQKIQGIY